MRIPLWLKIGWTLWLGVWMPYYWMQYGPQNLLYFCGASQRPLGVPSLCNLRTRLSVRAACASVFLEVLLRKAVEREHRNGAFETWSRKAPHALRAAPASERVAVNPDQAFLHTSLPFLRAFGIRARARRVEHINRSSAEGEILPVVADNVPWTHRSAK